MDVIPLPINLKYLKWQLGNSGVFLSELVFAFKTWVFETAQQIKNLTTIQETGNMGSILGSGRFS